MSLLGCDSAAAKKYQITVALEMASYVLIIFGVSTFVHRHHPSGGELYVLAAMPSVPILGVLFAVWVYLRDEKDEYQRDMMVKSMLWGMAAVLAMTAFFGFLRSFGWTGSVPPFTEFVTFWVLVALAKSLYRLIGRAKADE
jgi:lipopolysaccharide export LptBFGC system permease protein LptF